MAATNDGARSAVVPPVTGLWDSRPWMTDPSDGLAARILELEEMYAEDPGDALGGFMLGAEYLRAGRPRDAVEVFRAVVGIDPGYSAAHAGLGQGLEALDLPDEARVAWTEAAASAATKRDLQVAKQAEVALARLRT